MHVTPPKPDQATVDHTVSPEASVVDSPAAKVTLDFLAPAQQPDELGRLGHYRILKVLGKGGMGLVFLAEDSKLDRPVALKVMLPKFAEDEAAKQRFLREAKTAAAIEHDHIVHIYQVDEDRGVPFLAMQLLSGSSLENVLKRAGRLKTPQILRLGTQIAEGLAVAHAKGLIHRDIKPANIWVEANYGGRVKLLDFGLARTVQTDVGITQSGAIVGTPAYMPPEQARGEHVDHRCDLYSLGCVLYRMATGELPIKGKDTMALLMALALNEPTPPKQINEAIPDTLNDLIMKLLAKEADRRPESAKAVALALRKMEQEAAREGQASDVTEELAALAQPVPPPPSTIPVPLNLLPGSEQPGTPLQATKPDSAGTQFSPGQTTHVAAANRGRKYMTVAAGAALLAVIAVVFFVQTNYGMMRIEIQDPAIEVSVKGQGIVVKQGDTSNELRLPAGPIILTITRGAFTWETDPFFLKRGDKVVLEVRLDGDKLRLLRDSSLFADARITNYALDFDGVASSVQVPSLATDGTSQLTVECYFVPRRLDGNRQIVSMLGKGGVGLSLGTAPGGPRLAVNCFLGGKAAGRSVNFSDGVGKKHHLAAVWDGNEYRMYLNGKQAGTSYPTKARPSSLSVTTIGGLTGQVREKAKLEGLVWDSFDGTIDEVRVSKVARYDKDFQPKPRFEPDKDTLALYHFDEGQGDKLIDSSGNGHHGKIVGAKWVKVDESSPQTEPFAPYSASGKHALLFDGTSSFVDLPTLKYDLTHPLTIEVDVLPTSWKMGHIVSQVGGRSVWANKWKKDEPYFGFGSDEDKSRAILRSVPSQTVHVAGVFDGKELRLYLNGKLASKESTSTSPKATTAFKISSPLPFEGTIQRLRLSKIARYDKDFQPSPRYAPDKDTLALYHFDEGQGDKLIDSSGNGHHGKIVGAKWVKLEGSAISPPQNYALDFDGVGSHVAIPTLPVPDNDPFTIEAYVTPREKSRVRRVLTQFGSNTGLFHNQGRWIARKSSLQSSSPIDSLEVGRRVHLACVWDGKVCWLYVDGRQQQQHGDRPAPDAGEPGVAIGANRLRKGEMIEFFHGLIDEVRVSKGVRYAKDFTPAKRFNSDGDTLGLYHCDEGQGETLIDSSGNGHHGKIVGAKWVQVHGKEAASPVGQPKNALAFDGKADVVVPNIRWGPLKSMTCEAFVRLDQIQKRFCQVVDRYKNVSLGRKDDRWAIGVRLKGRTNADPGDYMIVDPRPSVVGERVHLAGVVAGQELRLFVNGKLVASKTLAEELDPGEGEKLQIGTALVGTLDGVRYSKVARYDRDFTPPVRFDADPDTLALYHFDEGQGEKLIDSSGNGHHGKIVGAKWMKIEAKSEPTAHEPFDADRRILEWIRQPRIEPMRAVIAGAGKERFFTPPEAIPADPVRATAVLSGNTTVISDTDLKLFAGHRTIRALAFGRSAITDRGLESLRNCTQLLSLSLNHSEIGDAALPTLLTLSQLSTLGVAHTRLSEEGLGKLADLPRLLALNMSFTDASDRTLDLLQRAPLHYLAVVNTRVTPAGIARFVKARPDCTIVSSLPVVATLKPSDPYCCHITQIRGGQLTVDVSGNKIGLGPRDPFPLQPFRVISVRWSETSFPGGFDLGSGGILWKLHGLSALAMVDLSGCDAVGDADLKALDSCPKLQRLNLAGTRIGEPALKHLAGIKSLNWLDLRGTKLSVAGVQTLSAALPTCQIESNYGTIIGAKWVKLP